MNRKRNWAPIGAGANGRGCLPSLRPERMVRKLKLVLCPSLVLAALLGRALPGEPGAR